MRATREVGVHRGPGADTERVTSLTVGEEVFVVEEQGGWTRVVAPDQPTHLDPAGYPGWVRTDALADDDPLAVARGFLGTRAGDLYFFGRPDEVVSHVAFVTDLGLLHASDSAGRVLEEPMPAERRQTLLGAGRFPA